MTNLNTRFAAYVADLADWEAAEAYAEFDYAVTLGVSDDEVMAVVEATVAMAA
jgi:hypothetical protein